MLHPLSLDRLVPATPNLYSAMNSLQEMVRVEGERRNRVR